MLEHVDLHRGVNLEFDGVHILVQFRVVNPGRRDLLVVTWFIKQTKDIVVDSSYFILTCDVKLTVYKQ